MEKKSKKLTLKIIPKKQDPRWKLTKYKSLADQDQSFYGKPWYEENEHKRYRVNLARSKKKKL